ncbi:hypothetical protein [Inhella sp.]|uniref:hypothetical protein n=1 Tax=Inhella sp. TaxID=1921806 RepID=UPI0035AFC960
MRHALALFALALLPLAGQAAMPQIASSDGHTLALKADGSLWAWGGNASGQLGDGTQTDRHLPVLIGQNFQQVVGNWHSAAGLTRDGRLWTWGANSPGAAWGWDRSARREFCNPPRSVPATPRCTPA